MFRCSHELPGSKMCFRLWQLPWQQPPYVLFSYPNVRIKGTQHSPAGTGHTEESIPPYPEVGVRPPKRTLLGGDPQTPTDPPMWQQFGSNRALIWQRVRGPTLNSCKQQRQHISSPKMTHLGALNMDIQSSFQQLFFAPIVNCL